MRKDQAEKIFQAVITLYDAIAEKYSASRYQPRRLLKRIGKNVPAGAKVLDVGCGNGLLLDELPARIDYHGVDVSRSLLALAQRQHPEKTSCFSMFNGLTLPFQDANFDWLFSVAVAHHIPSKDLRLKIFQDYARVLKTGGFAVITVWHFWQKEFIFYWLINIFKKIAGLSLLGWLDFYYPWKDSKGKVMGDRYFHMYTKRELEFLCLKSGLVIQELGKAPFQSGRFVNYYVIAKKV